MRILLATTQTLVARPVADPVYRSIVAVDLEGSTKRTNPVKGELRWALYDLLDRALQAAGISPEHLEHPTDRGDGVLILIRPHDDVPKTAVLGRLIPMLTRLLIEHNASVAQQVLQLRLRAVVHAGEVHEDDNGFYGDDLDVACRLLDSPKLKKTLKEAVASPLALVVSDEIYKGIVQQGYLDGALYRPLCRVLVGNRQRRGWVHIPAPVYPDHSAAIPRPRRELPSLAIASVDSGVSDCEAPRPGRG